MDESGLPWDESNPHNQRNGKPIYNVKSKINRNPVCLILITDCAEFPQGSGCVFVFSASHSICPEGLNSVDVLNDLSYSVGRNSILFLAVLFHNSK